MALNFQLGDVAEHEELLKPDGKPDVVTEVIIFSTMYLGINAITEATAEKFAVRTEAWQMAFGPLASQWAGDKWTPRPITLQDVRRHIGLRTNASQLTDAAFRKHLAETLLRDAETTVLRDKATLTQTAAEVNK